MMEAHMAKATQKAITTREDALRAPTLSLAARLSLTREEYIRAATPIGARKIRGNVRMADVIAIPRCAFTTPAKAAACWSCGWGCGCGRCWGCGRGWGCGWG